MYVPVGTTESATQDDPDTLYPLAQLEHPLDVHVEQLAQVLEHDTHELPLRYVPLAQLIFAQPVPDTEYPVLHVVHPLALQ